MKVHMLGLRSSERTEAQQQPSQPKKYDRAKFVRYQRGKAQHVEGIKPGHNGAKL
jgi:hypothetical protein